MFCIDNTELFLSMVPRVRVPCHVTTIYEERSRGSVVEHANMPSHRKMNYSGGSKHEQRNLV